MPGLRQRVGQWVVAGTERLLRWGLAGRLDAAPRPPAVAGLEARTDELNAAAERYFAGRTDREYQLGKPFTDPLELPQYLFNAGTLLHWLRAGPGDTVAEIGAGACWLSHFLNLYGCRTLAIDVSETALALGRERFERDPRTRRELDPAFLTYDGHRLPIDDGGCDRIVLHDAFHHLPNARELLSEMARVLKPGGIVAMSEPGRFHSQSDSARAEVAETGVLENDVVVEELAAEALARGFTRATVVPLALRTPFEIEAQRFPAFLRGERMIEHWRAVTAELLAHHYLLLYKGEPRPTTRRPGRLEAALRFLSPLPAEIAAGGRVAVRLEAWNQGDTRWLASTTGQAGWTRLGIHLEALDAPAQSDFDWQRADLPADLEPGERTELAFELAPLPGPGRYRLVFDLVAEHVTWFAERGSRPLSAEITVRTPEG